MKLSNIKESEINTCYSKDNTKATLIKVKASKSDNRESQSTLIKAKNLQKQ